MSPKISSGIDQHQGGSISMSGMRTMLGLSSHGRGDARSENRSTRRGLLLAITVSVGLSLAFAGSAGATAYKQTGSLSGTGITNPFDVSVDPSSHDIYVSNFTNETEDGPGAIARFDSSGNALVPAAMGQSWFSGVTVNPVNHGVYAFGMNSDTFANEIFTFNAAGVATGSFAAPGLQYSWIAGDAAGNIIVPNTAENTVTKVDSVGEPIGAFGEDGVVTCSDCPAPARFISPRSAEVDSSGNFYVGSQGETPARVNEKQKVMTGGGADGGTFTLIFESEITTPLPYNASADEIGDALRALSLIGAFDVSVSGNTDAWNVTFQRGLGGLDITQMSADGSNLTVGGNPGGTVTVTTIVNGEVISPEQSIPARVIKLNSSGAFQSVLYTDPMANALSVASDPASGNVFVLVESNSGSYVLGFDAAGTQFAEFGQGTISQPRAGIAVDPGTGAVYVPDGEGGAGPVVWVFTPVPAPTATTGAASALTQVTASLGATVNPKGQFTGSCVLEWGPTEGVYTTGSAPCSPGPGEANEDKVVAAPASGLSANTTYHYRVVIETDGGTAEGNDAVFSTLADTCATNAALCPPTCATNAALCAVPEPPHVPPAPTPPVTTPTSPGKKPLKCKKGFKKKTVKGKAKCVKVKKNHKKH